MVCVSSFVLLEISCMLTLFGFSWLHLAEGSRDKIDCSPKMGHPCTVYTYHDCAARAFESRHKDLFTGLGRAVPLKLSVHQSSIGSGDNKTDRPGITVFWWPLSHSTDALKGYEISMQGIKGVAKGTRKCFVIDTRKSNGTTDTEVIYNFTITPVLANSVYHFRILSLPHMRSRGSSNTATVETRPDSSRIVPSEWTTRVDCESRYVHKLTKVYVEYDLPPRSFKFPGVTVELVLNDNIISKQLSTKPFHLFETTKHGNYQVWVTPEDPFIYSPRACLCRNIDDICAGSCLTSFGICDVIPNNDSGMKTVQGRKDNKQHSNNNAEHMCTFVKSDIAEETGTNALFSPASVKYTDIADKPVHGHMSDRKDQYLHTRLMNDSLSNRACSELISLGGQSV
ncbi:uncharacterized protein LOC132553507 [Ylistrum balloti]|uniref:uncharacterized protein LOC132553507 n=1 Tax=Ylistrum balloti TaxID=509963 RepID=UPI0029057DFC|nr:uncharacterized protein LOC132553507 [Ylistrum balloti]